MFLCSDELFVVQKGKGGGSSNLLALPATIRTRKRVRAFMNLSRSSWAIILRGPTASHCAANSVESLLHADAPPQATQEGEMIESLAQMPTDTMIFLTMAVLGLAVMLIVLSRLI
jgi:hypothetical protein